MTGAVPVFLTPTRNNLGIIGPISKDEFSLESIQRKIDANPFAKEAQAKHPDRKPRILTITQSTYDGILYNVEQLRTMLDGRIGTLHFDEAWLPHAAFHHFYKDMHAIGPNRPQPEESMIFATHSTHKLLAGISQASQTPLRQPSNKKPHPNTFTNPSSNTH